MKRILLIFLLALAACSDPEPLAIQKNTLGTNARVQMATCLGQTWGHNLGSNYAPPEWPGYTFQYGMEVDACFFYIINPTEFLYPYSVKLKFKNLSTIKSLRLCMNGESCNFGGGEALSPLEEYTIDPILSFDCVCGEVNTCPWAFSLPEPTSYTFKIKAVGTPATVQVRVTAEINSPHSFYPSGQTSVITTTWNP